MFETSDAAASSVRRQRDKVGKGLKNGENKVVGGNRPETGKSGGFRPAMRHDQGLGGHARILKRDLAPFILSPPNFGYNNPPKYLRKEEIQRLFAAIDLSAAEGLRTGVMVRLAYTTGLRPGEIARIRLSDIAFAARELTVPERKGDNPIRFPLPDDTVKAMAAYIIGARPETDEDRLFVSLSPPHRPIAGGLVSDAIGKAMKAAGLPGYPYQLRHTYAQNLLESGASNHRKSACRHPGAFGKPFHSFRLFPGTDRGSFDCFQKANPDEQGMLFPAGPGREHGPESHGPLRDEDFRTLPAQGRPLAKG